jgi:hypothetical protein
MFKEAATHNNHTDIEEYKDTVTSYMCKCIDNVTSTKIHHHSGLPEAMADRGCPPAAEGERQRLQSWG